MIGARASGPGKAQSVEPIRILVLLAAAQLAACSPERPPDQPRDPPGETTSYPTTGAPPPPPPPAPGLTGLLPLGETEIAALGLGARCSLSDGGPPLMVARIGRAIANDRGAIVALAPRAKDWKALREGGRFEGRDLVIEIAPGTAVGRGPAGVVRDAGASVIRDGRGFSISHGPRWACAVVEANRAVSPRRTTLN